MFTIDMVKKLINDHDTTVTCFPYETAGVKFDDFRDREENSFQWDDELHSQLAHLAGVRPDNKTVYSLIPMYGKALYVEFWDNKMVISDQMFVRRSGELAWGLKLQMMTRLKDLMNATGFSTDQMRSICDEAILELERRK